MPDGVESLTQISVRAVAANIERLQHCDLSGIEEELVVVSSWPGLSAGWLGHRDPPWLAAAAHPAVVVRLRTRAGLTPSHAQDIFHQVIQLGKLTPGVLRSFQTSGHDRVLHDIDSLNIQDVPHVLPLTRQGPPAWRAQHRPHAAHGRDRCQEPLAG